MNLEINAITNTNTEFQISENSINVKNNDDNTSNKNENENENQNENETETETEKFRSAYHIACQWGSIKSLEFLLKLNSVMTIEDENENVTKNGKNEIQGHNVINQLDQRRDENVGGERVGSGFEIEIKYDNNNDDQNKKNYNFKIGRAHV